MTYDKKHIGRLIQNLDARGRVAFGLSCGERMFPNFKKFARDFDYGHEAELREALDRGWGWLQNPASQPGLKKYASRLLKFAPETEDFDTILVSSALDAVNVCSLLLELCCGAKDAECLEISTLSRDSVDMYVQELEDLNPRDPDLEVKIATHPLMIAEVSRQIGDLETLAGSWTVDQLEEAWRKPKRGSLGFE